MVFSMVSIRATSQPSTSQEGKYLLLNHYYITVTNNLEQTYGSSTFCNYFAIKNHNTVVVVRIQ